MTPRLSIIAAAIRRIFQGSTVSDTYDPYWDKVVLAMKMDGADMDPYWSNVVLAMPMDGTNGSTTFTDLKGNSVTASGSAALSNSQVKFGTTSAYFNGVSGSLSIPNSGALFDLSGNFTIDTWVYPVSLSSDRRVISINGESGKSVGATLALGTDGAVYMTFPRASSEVTQMDIVSPGGVVTTGAWHHIAVTKSGLNVTIFVNGSSVASTTLSEAVSTGVSTRATTIGSYYIGTIYIMNGYIDDLRITKGVVRYTSNFTVPSAPIQAPSFLDLKGHSVTANGNAVIQTTVKRFGTGAAYFDGSGDYLSLADSADWNFGTGDFCIEMWVNPASLSADGEILAQRNTADTSNFFFVRVSATTGKIRVYAKSGGTVTTDILSNVGVSVSTWTHVAVARINGLVSVYVGGVSSSTVTTNSTGAWPDVGYPLIIGAGDNVSSYFNGYIDDLRITKGVARYTSNFTPSSTELATSLPYDPYWDNVVLSMPMNGADTDPYWDSVVLAMPMDSALTDAKGHSVTVNGNSTIQMTTKKFGTGAAYFDGSGDYLSIPASSDFDFGTGDFTIELWARFDDFTVTRALIGKYNSWVNNVDFMVWVGSTDYKLAAAVGDNAAIALGSIGAITPGVWYHIAIARSSGVTRLFLNGNLETSSTTIASAGGSSAPLVIGGGNGTAYPMKGYIDDLRITKGGARYTVNFTPTTVAMPLSGSGFVDLKGHSVTANGNAVIQATVKKFGTGAAYFDGSGDFLKIPMSSDFDMGSGDFTIEFWYWPVSAVASDRIIQTRDGDIFPGIYLAHYSATQLLFLQSVNGTSFYGSGITFNITQNVWQHITIVKSSGSVKAYVNGTDVGVNYQVVGSMYYSSSDYMVIGGQTSGRTINGYIDDLRITKGVARYTSSFVPPQQALVATGFNSLSYDPYWSSTVLAMHMDSGFTDEKGKTLTAYSGAAISSTQSKFGGYSGYFTGSSYVDIAYSSDFDFGSGDFTIEAWVYVPDVSSNKTIIQRYITGNQCWDFLIGGTAPNFRCSTNGSADAVSVYGPTLSALTWTHVAVVRYGSIIRVFTNGVAGTDGSFTGAIYATSSGPVIGKNQDNVWYFNGYIDDLRVTKGVARYVDNFTPPTSAFKTL